jgi:hypothetical protein
MKHIKYLFIILFSIVPGNFATAQQLVWKPFGSLQIGRIRFEAQPLGNSQILVFGGHSGNTIQASCEIIDVNSRSVIPTSSMNQPRAEFASLMSKDSNIIAISGLTAGNNTTTSCELYNRNTRTWSIIGNLIVGRRQHTAVFISNNQILVAGGRDNSISTLQSAEVFDISTGQSHLVTAYPYYINNPVSGISSSGDYLVFGGRSGGNGSSQSNEVYKFNRVSENWTLTGTIPRESEFGILSVLWDKRLLFTGGNDENPRETLREISVENSGSMVLLGNMSEQRYGHGVGQWTADSVIIFGGTRISGGGTLYSSDWLNLSTGAVSSAPLLIEGRYIHRGISLPLLNTNGQPIGSQILAISGMDKSGAYLKTIEILEPESRSNVIAMGDTSICNGNAAQLRAYGAIEYLWSPGSSLSDSTIANPIAYPKITTQYIVRGKDISGNISFDTVIVTVNSISVSTSADTIICSGKSVQLWAKGGTKYQWTPTTGLDNPNSPNPIATPLKTTTYRVQITDDNGCKGFSSITVTVNNLYVSTSSDTTICSGGSVQLSAKGGTKYQWTPTIGLDNPNSPNPIATLTTTTTYRVQVTNDIGCIGFDSVTVRVGALAVTVMKDTILCGGSGASVQLWAKGGTKYQWTPTIGLDNPNSPTPVATPTKTTTYRVQVTNNNGCIGFDSVTVSLAPPITATVSPDTIICMGASVRLAASGGSRYRWNPTVGLDNPNSQNPLATPNSTTTYYVEVSNNAGCTTLDSIRVTIAPPINPSATPDTVICGGINPRIQLHAIGGNRYHWSPAEGLDNPDSQNPIATPNKTITYYVEVENNNGCKGFDSITISILPTIVTSTSPDTIICDDKVVQLRASGGTHYHWTPPDGLDNPNSPTPIAKPSKTTTYHVEITNDSGCIGYDSITITLLPPVIASVRMDTIICRGASVQLWAKGGTHYQWTPSDGLDNPTDASPLATPSQSTRYIVQVRNDAGCVAYDSTLISIGDVLVEHTTDTLKELEFSSLRCDSITITNSSANERLLSIVMLGNIAVSIAPSVSRTLRIPAGGSIRFPICIEARYYPWVIDTLLLEGDCYQKFMAFVVPIISQDKLAITRCVVPLRWKKANTFLELTANSLNLRTDKEWILRIFDPLGREKKILRGDGNQDISFQNLQQGMYYLVLHIGENTEYIPFFMSDN